MPESDRKERAKRLLEFCVKHDIACNREAIWIRLQAWDAQVARMRSLETFTPLSSKLANSTAQSSFEFGPRSTWPMK